MTAMTAFMRFGRWAMQSLLLIITADPYYPDRFNSYRSRYLMSERTFDASWGQHPSYEDPGKVALKGIEQPVTVYKLRYS